MNNSETPRADWFKSSYSNGTQNCVEVRIAEAVDTRDSKRTDGPVLTFAAEQWAAFVAGVADGQLDR
ncbi:DUF397 domain-containing protein [Streptomyces sp. 891-h]|uniref:DUF397 domain-containing protein n=1 Tax=unclassified Streptomyces TaxID=2593676 RepID=UPI001FA9DAEE|nr:DUF397 domain-containing protein [Streptomyces sp. 891-h]UNZ18858.1 DUF397 domain-containing protein [Streptomyces sp. 891-h]